MVHVQTKSVEARSQPQEPKHKEPRQNMSTEVSRLDRYAHIKDRAQTTQESRGQAYRKEDQERAHNNNQCVRAELKL